MWNNETVPDFWEEFKESFSNQDAEEREYSKCSRLDTQTLKILMGDSNLNSHQHVSTGPEPTEHNVRESLNHKERLNHKDKQRFYLQTARHEWWWYGRKAKRQCDNQSCTSGVSAKGVEKVSYTRNLFVWPVYKQKIIRSMLSPRLLPHSDDQCTLNQDSSIGCIQWPKYCLALCTWHLRWTHWSQARSNCSCLQRGDKKLRRSLEKCLCDLASWSTWSQTWIRLVFGRQNKGIPGSPNPLHDCISVWLMWRKVIKAEAALKCQKKRCPWFFAQLHLKCTTCCWVMKACTFCQDNIATWKDAVWRL